MDESSLLKDMGKRIVNRRLEMNITQDTLAEIACVSPATISAAENGNKALRPYNLLKISKALNISTDYLLSGEMTEYDRLSYFKDLEDCDTTDIENIKLLIKAYFEMK